MYSISIAKRDLGRGFPILLANGAVYQESHNRFVVPASSLSYLHDAGVSYRINSTNAGPWRAQDEGRRAGCVLKAA